MTQNQDVTKGPIDASKAWMANQAGDKTDPSYEVHRILGCKVHALAFRESVEWIVEACGRHRSGYVCAANTHSLVEGYYNTSVREALEDSDLVVPDGKPLVLAIRSFGGKCQHVPGPDLADALVHESAELGIRVGLFGGSSQAALEKLKISLLSTRPNLQLVYLHAPPFRPLTEEEVECQLHEMRRAGTQLLFVGLGMPKQELWMHKFANRSGAMCVGIGAAFDFIGGTKRRAPRWMTRFGFEWLHRLFSEPKRLASRYARVVPLFLFLFLKQKAGFDRSKS